MEQRSNFRFGGVEFDPTTGEVVRGGERARLEPQPSKVLALLAERGGELVGHEELRRHLWGEDTFVDFERGLRYCIARVRAALGDDAESPRFIETLPRRGYRLLPTVEALARGASAAEGAEPQAGPHADRPPEGARLGAAGPAPPRPPVAAPGRRLGTGLVIAAAAATLVAAGLALSRGAGSRAVGPRPVRLAVVPFDNETGLPAYDALARGLSDAAVARLSALDRQRLAVIGNAADLFVPRERRDLAEIGRRLEVEFVVLGQVQQAEARVRVIAHLIRVADQSHLWATRVEREIAASPMEGEAAGGPGGAATSPQALPDALALEEEVSRQVAEAIEARLLAGF